jgi:alpha-amylase
VKFSCQNGFTYNGQSIYVIGNRSEIGNWNTANAVKLDPTSYPTWTGSIALPSNTTIEWKCLKRDERNAYTGIMWEGGSNNVVNTGTELTSLGSF